METITIASVLAFGLAVIGWFLKRLVNDHDETKKKLDILGGKLLELRLQLEQNFVSMDTFETLRTEFRRNFENIFKEQAEQGKILARLDERSNWEERFAQILDRVAPQRRR